MQTTHPTHSQQAVQALLLRSLRGLQAACEEQAMQTFAYWTGHASALAELQNGTGAALSQRDRLFGVDTQASLQAAWAGLPVHIKNRLGAGVEQLCADQGAGVPA